MIPVSLVKLALVAGLSLATSTVAKGCDTPSTPPPPPATPGRGNAITIPAGTPAYANPNTGAAGCGTFITPVTVIPVAVVAPHWVAIDVDTFALHANAVPACLKLTRVWLYLPTLGR